MTCEGFNKYFLNQKETKVKCLCQSLDRKTGNNTKAIKMNFCAQDEIENAMCKVRWRHYNCLRIV